MTDPFAGAMAPPVVELTDVGRIHRSGSLEVAALRSVSLRIDAGEFVAITGPSGSGKSTLMNVLGCLDVPTSGRFELLGHDVSKLTENSLADVRNRMIGLALQQSNLLADMSAQRNVELPLVYARVSPAERRDRAARALARVGLSARASHRPSELSGGEQQRVAIARALVTEPALILADEPTGDLDSVSSADIMRLLADLHGEGRTVVIVTHDSEVADRASRIVALLDGTVVSDSSSTTSGGVSP